MTFLQFVLTHKDGGVGEPLFGVVNHNFNGKRIKLKLIHATFNSPTNEIVAFPQIPLALDFLTVTQTSDTTFNLNPTSSFRRDFESVPIFVNQIALGDSRKLYPGTEAARIFLPNQYTDITNSFVFMPPVPLEFTGICLGNVLTIALNIALRPPGDYENVEIGGNPAGGDCTRFASVLVSFDAEVL